MEDLYRKQNKLLKELYEGVNKELEILYKTYQCQMKTIENLEIKQSLC